MVSEISEKICKECSIKPQIRHYACAKGMGINKYINDCPTIVAVNRCEYDKGCNHNATMKPVYSYVDFELPENQVRLQKLLVDSGHVITLVEDWYSVGCGLNDFIDDCYDTQHAMTGKTFLDAVYNYITLWYEQREVRCMLKNGKMGPPMDMSHKLEAGECIYPWGYQSYVEDVEKLKQLIHDAKWEFPQ